MRLEEVYLSTHTFHYKTFLRPRSCDFCKQMLQNEGASCADCHYTCHGECRDKVISSCECPSRSSLKFSSLPREYHHYSYKSDPHSFIMDVVYLTRRIVFLSYPETGSNTTHASNLNEVAQMLNVKHGNNYMVFNLSERKHDLTQFKAQVLEFGWPPNLAPPLQRLCSICKAMDTWLISDPKSVVVLHSKGDKGRIGTIISAYIHYTSICSPNDQLLEKLSMKQYYAEKLSPYMHPCQKRYVHYFAGLLSGAIKMNNSSVFLHKIIIHGVPNFEITGGCKPFFKIYQGMQHIYTTKIFSVSGRARQIVINLDPSLQLHGDIMIKCYHSIQQSSGRSSIFRVQFHTCTFDKDWLSFNKEELDDASNDYRFPEDGRVEFHFADNLHHSKRNEPIFDATPVIDSNENNIVSWDSYENFNLGPEANLQLSPSNLSKLPLCKRETQLDELLDDMIREIHSISEFPISLPSHPPSNVHKNIDSGQTADYGHPQPIIAKYSPTAVISVNGNKQVLSSSPGWTKDKHVRDDDDDDKPYHTRKNCAPFTYGVSPGSPVLRRKYLRPVSPSPSADNQFKAENLLPRDILEEQVFVTDDTRFKEPNSQNWLMKQQEKLKARREGKVWEDRQQREQLLMAELLSSHKRMSPEKQDDVTQQNSSPVPRAESPSKGVSYSTPLHVTIYNGHAATPPPSHTMSKPPICWVSSAPSSPLLPSRSSSRDATRNRYQQWQTNNHPLTRQKSDTIADRERPFNSVKKAHQASREQMAANKTLPYQIISSSPVYGNISHQIPQDTSPDNDMLLTLLEQTKTSSSDPAPVSPTSSKLDELELSLQALSSNSPPRSPQTPHHGRFSPLPAAQSTPSKQSGITSDNASSWSLPVVSSSPPGSPSTSDRPETPAFPVQPGTPYFNHETRTGSGLPPKSPVLSRKDGASSPTVHSLHQSLPNVSHSTNGQNSPYFGQSQRSSMLSLGEPAEVIHHHPLFVKDTSKYWYKPNISREEAIIMLKDKPPGTFIVRDSNSFPGAFGLALKVATPPPNVQNTTGDISHELVRHFLIEPTSKGVRLKGCANEPVFGTLSALVYQHSMTPLALPCKLLLPESDPAESKIPETTDEPSSAPLLQGAACNLLYLGTADVETLTGSAAVERGFSDILKRKPIPKSSVIHFKVSGQGITLTDNSHKLFFRRHYPLNAISHCGLDPRNRRWDEVDEENNINVNSSHCFGFIAKKPGTKIDNQCHMLAELEAEQPASAIINFVHKVMASGGHSNKLNMI